MKEKVDFKAYQAQLASREAFEAAWETPIGGELTEGVSVEQKVEETKFTGRTIWLSNKETVTDPMWVKPVSVP